MLWLNLLPVAIDPVLAGHPQVPHNGHVVKGVRTGVPAPEVLVLDRPNPIDGMSIEGNVVQRGFESFVSAYPLAVRHGMTMGELDLLPTVRGAGKGTLIVAGGTSCRQQIRDGAARFAVHPARVLADALSQIGSKSDER